ncbi:[protein-PII] uridylyltransferase [Gammaproteobacteria bacterium]|nr:[protein-PII] uridylyltransferase [Gammaproteobacteria bacterium]
MIKNESNLNDDFLNNFPKIYQTPSLTNDYLAKNTSRVEKKILNYFKQYNLSKDFVIYANGGFGRKELYPSSDIDISIIHKNNKPKKIENLEKFIAKLWDLGYQIGHSVRSIKDIKKITKDDAKEFTSYLTRRALITNNTIDKEITSVLQKIWSKKKFCKVKLLEQEDRYKSFYSTAYNLEPDLKESPGCLRDFQTALWILQHCFDLKNIKEIKNSKEFADNLDEIIDSYNFVKSLRYITNSLSSRNRLTFELQIEIAIKANISEETRKRSVEKMMQKFYENASNLTNFNQHVFKKFDEQNSFSLTKNIGDYYIKGDKIGINPKINLSDRKDLIFGIYNYIGSSKKVNAIDTTTVSLLKNNLDLINNKFKEDRVYANQFLEIFRSKYNLSSILKSMKAIGIIQRYVDEFNKVIGQMQFDLFHVYTVDEHTFKVVRNMRQMKIHFKNEFKLEHELINRLPKIEILYLAGLFHDLGKGKGGDHSKIGAEISYNFAKKIGLSKADADLISWLVLHHLEMSSISQKKDISDMGTIEEFASLAKTTERLDYLYLLTVNDIRATNPALWNGWKHELLRDLFILTRSKINKEPVQTTKEITDDRKKNCISLFKKEEDRKKIKNYLEVFDDSFFTKNNLDKLKWQCGLIFDSELKKTVIGARKCFDSLLEIFIKTENFDGLFLKLVQVFQLSGLEIIDANISTSTNKNIAANTFIAKYSFHDRPLSNTEVQDIKLKISHNLKNLDTQKKELVFKKKKNESFGKPFKISNIEQKDKKRNLLTIETADSPGLLVKIAKTFFENGISIYSARINTLGDRVEDTFEIEDMALSSVSNKKIKKISDSLKETL